jgi:hypothetical protein
MEKETQILRPKYYKTVLLIIVSLAFTIGGLWMTKDEGLMGWLTASFFGICLLVFLIQLLPGSTQLLLTEDGFTMTSLFRSHFTKWTDVKSFKLGHLGRNKAVMFDYVDSHTEHTTGKSISKQLSGSHGALPDTYGMKATELLTLMVETKKKYDAQQGS